MDKDSSKINRVLDIYTKLLNGEKVIKRKEAEKHGVSLRTIQRDIEDIRRFLNINGEVSYKSNELGYILESDKFERLSNSEILAISKILLSSRAFKKSKIKEILEILLSFSNPVSNKDLINKLIKNELYHYVELKEHVNLENIWILAEAISNNRYIEIEYRRLKDKKKVKRVLKPAAILFSEFYFYLAAFIEDDEVKENFELKGDRNPTIYRIDRIKNIFVKKESFSVIYKDRFEEGDFINKIQFMYGGELTRVKFKYTGNDINYILDKLPLSNVIKQQENEYIVEYKGYGKGIYMWIKGQENVELV